MVKKIIPLTVIILLSSILTGGARRGSLIDYFLIGTIGHWWSSTHYDTDSAWYRAPASANSLVYRDYADKKNGFSVRCIKDN